MNRTTIAGHARRTRWVLVALAMVAGLVLAGGTPANAQTIVARDGFEDAHGVWQFQRSGTGDGGIEVNSPYAFEGHNNGWLTVQSGWSGVGRQMYLTSGISIRCNAWIYVQTPGATLNIEIIDPQTFNYIAVNTVTLGSTGSGYVQTAVGPWLADIKNVLFRVSLLATGGSSWVRLDGMGAQCWLG
jgi:hypothetical protein